MQLIGSCHCKAVTFTVRSAHPYPFCQCYCEICRKTAGAGGYAINLGAEFETLTIVGKENIRTYRARIADPESGKSIESAAERSFFAAFAEVRCGFGIRAGPDTSTRTPRR